MDAGRVLPWTPTDRPRHVIGLRYHSQHLGGSINFPDDILARLSPNTRELLQVRPTLFAWFPSTELI